MSEIEESTDVIEIYVRTQGRAIFRSPNEGLIDGVRGRLNERGYTVSKMVVEDDFKFALDITLENA